MGYFDENNLSIGQYRIFQQVILNGLHLKNVCCTSKVRKKLKSSTYKKLATTKDWQTLQNSDEKQHCQSCMA